MIETHPRMTASNYDPREHYEIERAIARRLADSTSSERLELYTWAYDELFRQVPGHPLLVAASRDERSLEVDKEVGNMATFLTPETVYLEIGSGDCEVAKAVASRVAKVFALDVSREIADPDALPHNFELVITDGTSIPVSPGSIDLAYSNQLMEHLHPDDAFEQLRNIFEALRPGGKYFCITPNRISGPHDISRNFDGVATCLHLREYTVTSMERLLLEAGFVRPRVYLRYARYSAFLPTWPYKIAERLLDLLPHPARKAITFNKVVRFVLGVKIVAEKASTR